MTSAFSRSDITPHCYAPQGSKTADVRRPEPFSGLNDASVSITRALGGAPNLQAVLWGSTSMTALSWWCASSPTGPADNHDSSSFLVFWKDTQVLLSIPLLCALSFFVNRALSSRNATRDTALLAILTTYFCRNEIISPLQQALPAEALISILILLLILLINSLQIAYLSALKNSNSWFSSNSTAQHDPATTSTTTACKVGAETGSAASVGRTAITKSPLKPLIFPSLTTHTRFFPRRHSFKYRYLMVGVPVGWEGSVGNLLSCSIPGRSSWRSDAWLSVHPEAYLFYSRPSLTSKDVRGPSLREKLDAYLSSEGVDPSTYPHAYLVTAPRVLGFSFNPVSFWYLYGQDVSVGVGAMILEVNNTFGERRTYFLQPDDSEQADDAGSGDSSAAGIKRFKSKWAKDFHVSPFNDREGVYSLSALDPVGTCSESSAEVRINNIITLSSLPYDSLDPDSPDSPELPAALNQTPRSSCSSGSAQRPPTEPKSSPKIIATISSLPHQPAVDPARLIRAPLRKSLFLLRWACVGFLTNPRILREARVLWTKGLRVWYRPEPKRTTLGREETGDESVVENQFRRLLQDAMTARSSVEEDELVRMKIRYTPAAGEERGRSIVFGGCGSAVNTGAEGCERESESGHVGAAGSLLVKERKEIEVKVLTPAFYAELVRATDIRNVWNERCLRAREGEGMVWTNDVEVLEAVVDDFIERAKTTAWPARAKTFVGTLNADLRRRRSFVASVIRAIAGHGNATRKKGQQEGDGINEMSFADVVYSLSPPADIREFERASLRILLADRIALGSTALLSLYVLPLRGLMILFAARQESYIVFGGGLFKTPVDVDMLLGVAKIVMMGMALGVIGRGLG